MLAHEAWLAKRMQSSRTGGHRTDVPRELPGALSELFALGVTLYQLLIGKPPYGEVLP